MSPDGPPPHHAVRPVTRVLGRAEYEPVWRAMQAFTKARDDSTVDELWFVEHPPVFTLGLAAKPDVRSHPTRRQEARHEVLPRYGDPR